MVFILSGPSCIGKGHAERAIRQAYPSVKKLRYYTTNPAVIPEDDNCVVLPVKDYASRVQSGTLVLNERRGSYFYAYVLDDLLKDDGVYIVELSPKTIKKAKEIIPKCKAISLIVELADIDILRERMYKKGVPHSLISERLDEAASIIRMIRENYHYYDAIALVTKKNEPNFSEMIVSLFSALVPAYS